MSALPPKADINPGAAGMFRSSLEGLAHDLRDALAVTADRRQ
jgi:hypothetical protein